MTVLGISVGTSRTGVCVLQEGKLIDLHIHDYPNPWSDNKLRIILNKYRQYLKRYPITHVIIKVPPPSGHSKPLRRLLRRIEALAGEYYCEFDLITKTEIKGTLLLRSTEEIIIYAKGLFHELTGLYDKGRRSNHSYQRKLYEAVLAAHIYEERQRVRKLYRENTKE